MSSSFEGEEAVYPRSIDKGEETEKTSLSSGGEEDESREQRDSATRVLTDSSNSSGPSLVEEQEATKALYKQRRQGNKVLTKSTISGTTFVRRRPRIPSVASTVVPDLSTRLSFDTNHDTSSTSLEPDEVSRSTTCDSSTRTNTLGFRSSSDHGASFPLPPPVTRAVSSQGSSDRQSVRSLLSRSDHVAKGLGRTTRRGAPSGPIEPSGPGAEWVAGLLSLEDEQNDVVEKRREGLQRDDSSFQTSIKEEAYVVTAMLVEEQDKSVRTLLKEKSVRYRALEERQTQLEKKMQDQDSQIQQHKDQLEKLKDSHGNIVEAEVIATPTTINSQKQKIKNREELIDRMISSPLLSPASPGVNLSARSEHTMSTSSRHRRMEGGMKKLLGKLKVPFSSRSSHDAKEVENEMRGVVNTNAEQEESDNLSSTDKEASIETSMKDLDELAAAFKKNSKIEDRIYHLKTYKQCFVGNEAVDYLVESGAATSRQDAVELGRALQARHLFEHVTQNYEFLDDHKFFRFLEGTEHGPFKVDENTGGKEDMRHESLQKLPSFYAPTEKDTFEGFSIGKLKKMAQDTGVDVSECIERSQMVACLQEAGVTPQNYESKSRESQKGSAAVPEKRPSLYVPVEKDPFEGFSVGKLKKIAQDSCVDVSDCVERRQICSRLQEAGITRKNYDKKIRDSQKNNRGTTSTWETQKKPSFYTETKQKDSFEGYRISQLKDMARDAQVDVSTCYDRCTLVSELLDAGLAPKSGFKFFGGRGKGNEKPAANSNGRKDKAEVKRKEGRKETAKPNEGTGKEAVKRKDTKKRAAQFIPTQKDAFEAYNVSQLKAIARASKISVSSCVERSQIVEKLLRHGVKPAPYVGYSVWKLKKVAKEKTVDISGCVEKEDFLTRLIIYTYYPRR